MQTVKLYKENIIDNYKKSDNPLVCLFAMDTQLFFYQNICQSPLNSQQCLCKSLSVFYISEQSKLFTGSAPVQIINCI